MQGAFNVEPDRVWGWCRGPQPPGQTYVQVYLGSIFIRRLRCNQIWPTPPQEYDDGQARGFSMSFTHGLRELLPQGLSIRVIDGEGRDLLRQGADAEVGLALDGGQALKEKMDAGWCVDKWGGLVLPFAAAPGRDQEYMDYFAEISALLERKTGYKFFLAYGTLLGAIRDNRLIAHDDDVDCSYMSRFSTSGNVAREFHALYQTVSEVTRPIGSSVKIIDTGQMYVTDGKIKFDIFTSWIDRRRNYNCYFGVSASLGLRPFLLKRGTFMGHRVWLPRNPQRLLEWTYGPNWAVPDPHFSWIPPERTTRVMQDLRDRGRELATPAV